MEGVATQSPSPQPNQVIEEEEKLLGGGVGGGHTTDEEVTTTRRSPKRDYLMSSSSPASAASHHHHQHQHHRQQQQIDHQLEIARNRVELAIEEYHLLMKEQLDSDGLMHRRAQTLPNSVAPLTTTDGDNLSSGGGGGGGGGSGKSGSKRRKFRSARHEADPNNNIGSGKSSAKSSRFSSLRRPPPLRRQTSSRMSNVERSPSGLSYVDYISRFIFPAAFVLFGVIYWTILFYFKLS